MQILDYHQIQRKTRRLALQILEHNLDADMLYVGGINHNGKRFAHMLIEEINKQSDLETTFFQIELSPADPLSSPIKYDIDPGELRSKHVLLVDDVANTGRTLFYAFNPLMEVIPGSVEIAVLVDRKHKSFPVKVDYVGLSLATTLKDDIRVHFEGSEEHSAHLQ